MTPEEIVAAVMAACEGLKNDIGGQIAAMDAKHNALADSVAKLAAKDDAAGARLRRGDEDVDGTMARRVAADSVDDFRHEVRLLASAVEGLRKNQTRPMADLNKFADIQSKADSVMRALGSAAEPPMSGEHHMNYLIRLHRKMQNHSPRWKGVDLNLIAREPDALEGICDQIRSDAMEAARSPVGMPEFQHRVVTKTSPGGHTIREFIGNGTIIKQMARTPRHLATINTTNSMRAR